MTKILELKFPKREISSIIIKGALPYNVKKVGNIVVAKWTWWCGNPITPLGIIFSKTKRDMSILEWMDIHETIIFASKVPNSSTYFVKKVKIRYIPIKKSHKWHNTITYYAQVLGIPYSQPNK